MIEIRLYWRRGDGDINLGVGFHEVLPAVDTRLVYACDHGVVWRVLDHYHHLTMPGSVAWRAWAGRGQSETARVDVFVEPAEGPFAD